MRKKEAMLLIVSIIISIFFYSGLVDAALGISPSKFTVDFQPNLKQELTFNIIADNPDKEYEVYVKGDLAEYIKVNKQTMKGGGQIVVNLNLPSNIEKPGNHRILIGVREKLDEELSVINVAEAVQSPIDIFVPYPGKYLEANLKSYDVNQGEVVEFKLLLSNRGKEDLEITPVISISSEEVIETLVLSTRELLSQEEVELKKDFDTSNIPPGNYEVKALIPYGEKTAQDNKTFRVGTLNVDVIEVSKKVEISKLSKFDLRVLSKWNSKIDAIYADVEFYKDRILVGGLRTTPTSLESWADDTIYGYFDSSNFTEGKYDANITIYYSGEQESVSEEVEFYKKLNYKSIAMWVGIGAVIVLLLGMFIYLTYLIRKYGKKK